VKTIQKLQRKLAPLAVDAQPTKIQLFLIQIGDGPTKLATPETATLVTHGTKICVLIRRPAVEIVLSMAPTMSQPTASKRMETPSNSALLPKANTEPTLDLEFT
jgi:hypothetical protein